MSEVKTNKISSVSTNGDITLDPDGTGDTVIASGNVGIGTTSPSGELHVKASSGFAEMYVQGSSSTSGMYLFDQGSEAGLWKVDSGYLAFATGNTERMRINSSGTVLVKKTSTDFNTAGIRMDSELNVTRASNTPVFINRTGNDGGLIQFYQAGTEEGSISVSGTSVNYNGGVLSRWSRLIDDTTPASLVRGTVMSNLDSMIVWSHDAEDAVVDEDGNEITPAADAYDEDNEKLNHTQVSTVEGDVNSAGVFMAWDNDDDNYNDFYLAMTGDFVIRIASGTTVARGDLLMSAGDGTAKPQGDDIVRSKTIAKVTSTTVSHTYDDGTFLVPCVLMAC